MMVETMMMTVMVARATSNSPLIAHPQEVGHQKLDAVAVHNAMYEKMKKVAKCSFSFVYTGCPLKVFILCRCYVHSSPSMTMVQITRYTIKINRD
mmetsp:Transcript_22694/g.40422  ORF Transcript_22694/g.40422 Transcript_22694/m.40422 type:complete len:95 (+) Transcript_22694:1-285(+)